MYFENSFRLSKIKTMKHNKEVCKDIFSFGLSDIKLVLGNIVNTVEVGFIRVTS